MYFEIKEKVIMAVGLLIISCSITSLVYTISSSICDYFKLTKFTYYSFMYMQEMVIDIKLSIMIILGIIFSIILYKALSFALDL